jgi:hypothetical protein
MESMRGTLLKCFQTKLVLATRSQTVGSSLLGVRGKLRELQGCEKVVSTPPILVAA